MTILLTGKYMIGWQGLERFQRFSFRIYVHKFMLFDLKQLFCFCLLISLLSHFWLTHFFSLHLLYQPYVVLCQAITMPCNDIFDWVYNLFIIAMLCEDLNEAVMHSSLPCNMINKVYVIVKDDIFLCYDLFWCCQLPIRRCIFVTSTKGQI